MKNLQLRAYLEAHPLSLAWPRGAPVEELGALVEAKPRFADLGLLGRLRNAPRKLGVRPRGHPRRADGAGAAGTVGADR